MPLEYIIIPFSGIQVMDFGIDLTSVEVRRRRFAQRPIDPNDDSSFKQLIPVMEDKITETELAKKYGDDIFSEQYENVINECDCQSIK